MLTPKSPTPSLRLGHVALRVQNLPRSQAFYQNVFSMQGVWSPDEENVYLSLGRDNLALHQVLQGSCLQEGNLDHIGFIVDQKEEVDTLAERMMQLNVPIVRPVRLHRDGSYSFYIEDPDRNLIQILYIPPPSPAPG